MMLMRDLVSFHSLRRKRIRRRMYLDDHVIRTATRNFRGNQANVLVRFEGLARQDQETEGKK